MFLSSRDSVYLTANEGSTGTELWRIDDNGLDDVRHAPVANADFNSVVADHF